MPGAPADTGRVCGNGRALNRPSTRGFVSCAVLFACVICPSAPESSVVVVACYVVQSSVFMNSSSVNDSSLAASMWIFCRLSTSISLICFLWHQIKQRVDVFNRPVHESDARCHTTHRRTFTSSAF